MPDHVALEKLALEAARAAAAPASSPRRSCDSFEDRDAFVASGMETGIVQGYERLDELLAAVSRHALK